MSSSHSIEGLKSLFETLNDEVDNIESISGRLCVKKEDLDNHCISPTDDCSNYTPLQFGSKWGLVSLVKILLQSDVEIIYIPHSADERLKKEAKSSLNKVDTNNSPTVKTRTQDTRGTNQNDCKIHPLFLAAVNGQHSILKLFKYHNFSSEETCMSELIAEDDECFQYFITHSKSKNQIDFTVLEDQKGMNLLHTVLRQPLIKDEIKSRRKNQTYKRNIVRSKKIDEEVDIFQRYANSYRECINVLLDMDRFSMQNVEPKCSFPMQIRSIVNQQDHNGNTPLHYAVANWSDSVVKRLLSLGANAGIKNGRGEIPLKLISKPALDDFLNKQCIIVQDYDPSDDEVEEDTDEEEEIKKISQDYNPTFMMKISQCGKDNRNEMKFDYAFLSPPKRSKQQNERTFHHGDPDVRVGNDPESQKTEKMNEEYLDHESEMDLLWEMSRSECHRSLIIHPVITSFLWLKWKLMSRFFNRSLRLDFLFCYSVIWYIFTRFGGAKWNDINLDHNSTSYDSLTGSRFCAPESYNLKIAKFDKNGMSSFSMLGYYFHAIFFVLQLVLMTRDLRRDLALRRSQNRKITSQSPIVACWIDALNCLLSSFILLGGKDVLWLIITVILVFYVITELVQMTLNMTSLDFGYFKQIGNLLDLGIIFLVFIILFLPNSGIVNSYTFSVFDKRLETNEENNEEHTNCRVLRCISGMIIVLVSLRYLMSISKLPRFKNYNLYVIMFYKVTTRYVKIMVWYSFYLIAFGLGFYIILHPDVKKRKRVKENSSTDDDSEDTDVKENKFRNPFLALVKTSVMFVGELEYSDFQIRGGDVSVTLTYAFLLLFMFLMIIVLMNLLNGMAVSETGQIMKDSLIENQVCFINTIRFFESLYVGQIQKIITTENKTSCLKRFVHRYVLPKGLLLFQSPYLVDNMLSFPIREDLIENSGGIKITKQEEGKSSCNCLKVIIDWYSLGIMYENIGTEEFLNDARNILIRERSRKVEARREKNIHKRSKEMSRGIKEIKSYLSQHPLYMTQK